MIGKNSFNKLHKNKLAEIRKHDCHVMVTLNWPSRYPEIAISYFKFNGFCHYFT